MNQRTCVFAILIGFVRPLISDALNQRTPAALSRLFSSRHARDGAGQECFQHSSFDHAVLGRFACKKFRRFDGAATGSVPASQADPAVLQQVIHCLNLARRTPSAFNTQPYKVVLVHNPKQKDSLSKFCLGPNAIRIRDSDCTAIFLADRQVSRTLARFRQFLDECRKPNQNPLSRRDLFLMQFYILLFSSGYPLPRFLSATISFCVRTSVAFLNLLTSRFYPLPSLANAETWSSKQASMVALTFMLGCSSLGLATIPMEGISARGIRKIIGAPSRYAVPLVVSIGCPLGDNARNGTSTIRRYPLGEVVFDGMFGATIEELASSNTASVTTL
jgi:nitroreductase